MNARAYSRACSLPISCALGLALVLTLLASPARAFTTDLFGSIDVLEYSLQDVHFRHVHNSYDGGEKTYDGNYAGEMKVSVTDPAYGLTDYETVAYCVQIEQGIDIGHYEPMTLEPLTPTVDQEKQIAWLMNEYAPAFYGASVPNSYSGAALQLAIWDVVNTPETYEVYESGTNSTVWGLYGDYMAALPDAASLPDLTWKSSYARLESNQDLVVYTMHTPLPSSLLLLGGGLVALAGFARRRRSV